MLRRRWLSVLLLILGVLVTPAFGCNNDEAVKALEQRLQAEHVPRVKAIIDEDVERHKRGIAYAADRVAAGFVKAQPEHLEQEMRQVLKLVRSPKKGVSELVISPMSFMAAVGKDGKAIARDSEPDGMKGMPLGELFPEVRKALAGELAYGVGEFANSEPGGETSVSLLMAAPAHYQGEVVGALALGIPLWRLSQRLSRQLQTESKEQGVILWVYVFRGDRLFHHGTPPDLDQLVPGAEERRKLLAAAGGTMAFGHVDQYGFTYGYGIATVPLLGEDAGVIVFRMNPDA